MFLFPKFFICIMLVASYVEMFAFLGTYNFVYIIPDFSFFVYMFQLEKKMMPVYLVVFRFGTRNLTLSKTVPYVVKMLDDSNLLVSSKFIQKCEVRPSCVTAA